MTTKIEYVKGNVLDHKGPIVQCCNTQGVWGAGVALAIKNKWPDAYVEHQNYVRRWGGALRHPNSKLMGLVQWEDCDAYTLFNIFGQLAADTSKRAVDYEAIIRGLEDVQAYLYTGEVVGMPKIGCGLAGGNWRIMEAIIEETLVNPVKVYVL